MAAHIDNNGNVYASDGDRLATTTETAEEAKKQTQHILANIVQMHLDEKAQERNYDNILSACSYAAVANTYRAEGQAYLSWRATCWDKCYVILAAVRQGQKYNPAWTVRS